MSISLHCDCGKKFAVKDEFAGKKIRCPKCKSPLVVEASELEDPIVEAPAPSKWIRFECDCGEPMKARSDRAGSYMDCPDCGDEVRVPGGKSSKREVQAERPTRRSRDYDEEDEPRKRPARRKPRKKGGSKLGLWIGLACLLLLLVGGGLTAYFLFSDGGPNSTSGGDPSTNGGPSMQDPAQDKRNLKQILFAMHHFADVHRYLPPAQPKDQPNRHPSLSWRVDLLPYLEEGALYKEIRLNEPYDSPHNRKLWSRMPATYASPGMDPSQGKTRYQIFKGEGTAFSGGRSFPIGITDGVSNTIFVTEALQEVNWMSSDDIEFQHSPDGFSPAVLGKPGSSGFFVAMGDGAVLYYRKSINPVNLQGKITARGGELPTLD